MTTAPIALLRAPPFPWFDAAVSVPAQSIVPEPDEVDRLFAAIREARVGGAFWAAPALDTAPGPIIRAASADEAALAGLSDAERTTAVSIAPTRQVDPWSALTNATSLLAHGDDEWAALAHIAGVPVRFLSPGRFGAPGASDVDIRHTVAAELFGRSYRDPFTGRPSDVTATIAQLGAWRQTLAINRPLVATCGMAWWKRQEIRRFLWSPDHSLRFFRSERRAIAYATRRGGAVAVWPSRISPGMADAAQAQDVPLVRVEDGFIRSVGLGSDLVPPASITVDRLGIHYDPGCPSDLEAILVGADFPPALLERAARLRQVILSAGISKYGGQDDQAFPSRDPNRRLVLVPGQVEDDMSVRLGGGGLSSNLELLRRARALEPDAEIWFRPHPDVDAGHRKGLVRDADALLHADHVVRGGSMARLLDHVDAVHVLTSLTGFEALLRGRAVTCHGTPFFAGWGLTHDLGEVPERRGRALTLDQLIAAVLIVYPRYLDPVSGLPCPPEVLIARMIEGGVRNRLGWVTRLRRLQGRLAKRRG